MRVTDQMKTATVSHHLASLQSRQLDASQRAASGTRLQAPSTDPIAAADAVRLRSAKARTEAYQRSVDRVTGDAQQAEALLAEADGLFKRAHEIALQGANDVLNAEDRANLAREVADLRAQLLSVANARGSRGYLFAGTLSETRPFDAAGTFSGNDEHQLVEIGAGQPRAVSTSGAQAFTAAGGRDVFADLIALEGALAADDRALIARSIDEVELSRDQIVREQGRTGLTLRQLEQSRAVLESVGFELDRQHGVAVDADAIESLSDLNQLGTTLEQAVAVARTVLGQSLLNRF